MSQEQLKLAGDHPGLTQEEREILEKHLSTVNAILEKHAIHSVQLGPQNNFHKLSVTRTEKK
jgi:hypothetical protein